MGQHMKSRRHHDRSEPLDEENEAVIASAAEITPADIEPGGPAVARGRAAGGAQPLGREDPAGHGAPDSPEASAMTACDRGGNNG